MLMYFWSIVVAMKVQIEKTDTKPIIRIHRDDSVSLRMRPPDRKFSPPHDLVHFVVEQSLGLMKGFWGTVALGALFPSMTVIEGRQPPHANTRSKALMKNNRASLSEAEVFVGAFQHVLLENPKSYREKISRRLANTGRPVEIDDIERTWTALISLRDRWNALATGGRIVLEWQDYDKSRSKRS